MPTTTLVLTGAGLPFETSGAETITVSGVCYTKSVTGRSQPQLLTNPTTVSWSAGCIVTTTTTSAP